MLAPTAEWALWRPRRTAAAVPHPAGPDAPAAFEVIRWDARTVLLLAAAWLTPTLAFLAGGVLPDVVVVVAMLAPLAGVLVVMTAAGPTAALPYFVVGAVAILMAPPLTLIWRPAGVDALLLATALVGYWSLGGGLLWYSRRVHEELRTARLNALFDDLTGAPNRRHARMVLEREFAAARRGRPLVVAICDIDDFKSFNDRHGHTAGDAALRDVAGCFTDWTRAMNLAARWGGEEFLIILSSCDTPGALSALARIREDLARLRVCGERLTVSIGVAAYHSGFESMDALLDAADQAQYAAKEAGGDTIRAWPVQRAMAI